MLRSNYRFKRKKKGFSLSLSTLVMIIIAAISVFILIFSVYYVLTSSSKDALETEKKVYDQIKDALPFFSGLLVFYIAKNKKRGFFALKTIFYLLLCMLIAMMLILLVLKAKEKAKNPGIEIDNPSLKIKCSQECALDANYKSCFENCIKKATKKEEKGEKNDKT